METKKPFYDCCPHITHWIVNCFVDTDNNITFVFIWTTSSSAVMRGRLKITLSITRLGLSPSVQDHILFLKWSVFNNWEFNKVHTELDHIWLYFLWKNTVQWFDDICAIIWTQIGWWLSKRGPHHVFTYSHETSFVELRGQEGEVPLTPGFHKVISNPPENTFHQGTLTSEHIYLIIEVSSMCH